MCTARKTQKVQAIDEQIRAHEFLILRVIHKYQLYTDKDYYMQIGRLALWNALKGYEEKRGAFEMYAYICIKYAIMRELRLATTIKTHEVVTGDEYLIIFEDENARDFEMDERPAWYYALSAEEQQLIDFVYYKGYSMVEMARVTNRSYEALKKHKTRILVKLKKLLEQQQDEQY